MKSITAMVVEDERSLANLYALMLARLGAAPEISRDGQLARDRILEGLAPRILLLDLHLPHVSGEDLLKDIEESSAYSDTRIIIVTADPDWGLRLKKEHPRIWRVLTKPIEFSDLQEEIESLN